jgi:hypothetical protein
MAKKLFRWECKHCEVEFYGTGVLNEKCEICGGGLNRLELMGYVGGMIKIMDKRYYKWLPKIARATVELNRVLHESLSDGVIPKIIVHDDEKTQALFGKNAQVVEVSIALGELRAG